MSPLNASSILNAITVIEDCLDEIDDFIQDARDTSSNDDRLADNAEEASDKITRLLAGIKSELKKK